MAGRLRHKPEMYGSGGNKNTAWEMDRVLKEYDSLMSKNIAEANAWRLVGLVAVAMLIVLSICFAYIGLKPKREFVVIGVNDIGQTKYYGNLAGKSFDEYVDVERVIKNNIKEFLTNRYTVSTDSDVMAMNFTKCLYYLDSNRRQALINEINAEDPFSLVGKLKRNVIIDTVIPLSKQTFQTEFYVTESEFTGYKSDTQHYRAVFTFDKISAEKYQKLNEKEYMNNASGFYITDYNIQKIKVEVK